MDCVKIDVRKEVEEDDWKKNTEEGGTDHQMTR